MILYIGANRFSNDLDLTCKGDMDLVAIDRVKLSQTELSNRIANQASNLPYQSDNETINKR